MDLEPTCNKKLFASEFQDTQFYLPVSITNTYILYIKMLMKDYFDDHIFWLQGNNVQ
jgi:hypothetical protein